MQQGALSAVDSMEQTRGKTGDQKVIYFILFLRLRLFTSQSLVISVVFYGIKSGC